eukprot:scaffold24191_cov69-Phaeocystis_antarctica.AAC.7
MVETRQKTRGKYVRARRSSELYVLIGTSPIGQLVHSPNASKVGGLEEYQEVVGLAVPHDAEHAGRLVCECEKADDGVGEEWQDNEGEGWVDVEHGDESDADPKYEEGEPPACEPHVHQQCSDHLPRGR